MCIGEGYRNGNRVVKIKYDGIFGRCKTFKEVDFVIRFEEVN